MYNSRYLRFKKNFQAVETSENNFKCVLDGLPWSKMAAKNHERALYQNFAEHWFSEFGPVAVSQVGVGVWENPWDVCGYEIDF